MSCFNLIYSDNWFVAFERRLSQNNSLWNHQNPSSYEIVYSVRAYHFRETSSCCNVLHFFTVVILYHLLVCFECPFDISRLLISFSPLMYLRTDSICFVFAVLTWTIPTICLSRYAATIGTVYIRNVFVSEVLFVWEPYWMRYIDVSRIEHIWRQNSKLKMLMQS